MIEISETDEGHKCHLIHQTNHLLDRHLRHREKTFLRDGGMRKPMMRAPLHAPFTNQPARDGWRVARGD